MDFSKLTLFSLMNTKMAYDSERQSVLALNLANIDTPGYQPRDLRPLDFDNLVAATSQKLDMRATSPMHFTGPTSNLSMDFRVQQDRNTFEIKPIKNAVVLEEQMTKVAQTQLDYQTTTQLYRKQIDMFKTATVNR